MTPFNAETGPSEEGPTTPVRPPPARFPQSRIAPFLPLAGLAVFLVAVFLIGRHNRQNDEAEHPFFQRFQVFGTFGEIVLYHKRPAAKKATEAALLELEDLHNRVNVYDPESELSRLNASAADAAFACSPALWDVLQAARRAYRTTDGAFDVTVGPLMHLWGFHAARGEWPSKDEIATARGLVGLEKVRFLDQERAVRFSVPGMRLDLGGIIKGYALDRVAEILRDHGLKAGMVNLGGNILALNTPGRGRLAYRIGIRNPQRPDEVLGQISLRKTCVATSGNYENYRRIGDRVVTHIVDPRTGHPVADRLAVTVVTPRGVDSDVFSTAAFVGGEELARRLASETANTRILICEADEDDSPRTIPVQWRWAPDQPQSWISRSKRFLQRVFDGDAP